jgi:cytoskeletal protein RodZ
MTNNNLNADQQQQLAEVGLKLQQLRTAKNISLETIAANTKISKRLLAAIETGNMGELPEPYYVRALVAKFAHEIAATDIEFILPSVDEGEVSDSHSQTGSKIKRRYWLNFQLRSLHLYLLYILLVIISVTGITILVERPVIINQASELKPSLDSEIVKSTVSPSSAANQPKSVPQFVSRSNNSQSVTVGINLQERCWLKVMVDGKVAFEGTLPQGTQRQWAGKKEVTIRAGNAGGVVISFNNEKQKLLGAPGQVEEITYTLN